MKESINCEPIIYWKLHFKGSSYLMLLMFIFTRAKEKRSGSRSLKNGCRDRIWRVRCIFVYFWTFKNKCLIFGKALPGSDFKSLWLQPLTMYCAMSSLGCQVSGAPQSHPSSDLNSSRHPSGGTKGPPCPRSPPINEIFTKKTVPECKQTVLTISLLHF